jgi:hypothetical protein
MEFRVYVYAAVAPDLGNVAKSRVNAELHAYASPIQFFKNRREKKRFAVRFAVILIEYTLRYVMNHPVLITPF